MKSLTTGRLLLSLATVSGIGLLAAPSEARADTNLTFCNKTGANIYIAVAYVEAATNRWVLSAWHTRAPGTCDSIGNIKTGLFYYFAEKEGRTAFWPAKENIEKFYCVPATRVKRDLAASSCAPGERSLGFRGRVTEPGKYTFSFS
jgi:uncharacterized membrane protein